MTANRITRLLPAACLLVLAAAACGGGGGGSTTVESPTSVFGRQARELAVGVAARRDGSAVAVETTVLGQDGAGRADLRVEVASEHGPWVLSTLCGDGSYCGTLDNAAAPRPLVRVRLTRPAGRRSTLAVRLPARPRPAQAGALVAESAGAIRDLQSLIIHEYLASGPAYRPLVTEFSYVAPDRLAYTTAGAGSAVVIGGRRWDRESATSSWAASKQEPVQVPAPDWRRAVDASMLGSALRDGRRAWRVSFYDPTTPAWFELEIDKQTHLPLWLHMTAAAHFMTHTFHAFNAPLVILPPA